MKTLEATPILNWGHPLVARLAAQARGADDRARLIAAHRLIAARLRPVYALNEFRPVSRTLALGKGSCSQRLAVLEAVARADGIATRVKGLRVDGGFWHARFPLLRPLIPRRVLLAWPEFLLEGRWVPVSEVYECLDDCRPFTNSGAETLFEAVGRTSVDLSAWVLEDLGYFSSRDELFRRFYRLHPRGYVMRADSAR
ncbi:transglutaminase domain-containing protein [Nonomuraea dietziae]|uniref:transglutaminase domain-containing protein n=1 Tax=Nonomuraea dietziae TaxID=65515 RepID=UPI00341C25A1